MAEAGHTERLPVRVQSPEERELEHKRVDLAGLEADLVERELRLATLQAELAAFEAEYLRVVGRRYAELDDVKARIAEARAARRPDDVGAQASAAEARAAAANAASEVRDRASPKPAPAFDPPADLRTLYRTLARRLHPDLASTDDDRKRRHEWMARVNDAYQRQDPEALNALLADWDTSPEAVAGTGIGDDLVRVIRQIAQARRRIASIDREIEVLMAGDLYALYRKCNAQQDVGRNLLTEMAELVDKRIADAKQDLADLKVEAP